MTRHVVTLFLYLACLFVSVNAFAQSSVETVASKEAVMIKEATVLAENLRQSNIVSVIATFNDPLRQALGKERLVAVWTPLALNAGVFKKQLEPVATQTQTYTVVVVTCVYSNAALDIKITYDQDAKVAGLFFVPRPVPVAGLTENGTDQNLPTYIDKSKFSEQDLAVSSGTSTLPGTLSLPNQGSNLPVVILVHGSGPSDRDETIGPNKIFRDIAWGLASQGIAVIRYEKRTHLHPEAFIDKQFTINDETVDDAVAATMAVRKLAAIDSTNIYVLGHSLGAMMAPRIGTRNATLAGLILLAAPARPLEDILVEQHRYLSSLTQNQDPNQVTMQTKSIEEQRQKVKHLTRTLGESGLIFDLPASYWMDLQAYDPVKIARNLPMPILVIQGGRDFQVSPDLDFPRWESACSHSRQIQCKLLPNLNHEFITGSAVSTPQEYSQAAHVDEQAISTIANWIKTRSL
jgi:dienelactone hydrolase